MRNGDQVPFTSTADPTPITVPPPPPPTRRAGQRAAVAVLRAHAVAHPRRDRSDHHPSALQDQLVKARAAGCSSTRRPTPTASCTSSRTPAPPPPSTSSPAGCCGASTCAPDPSLPALGSPAIGGKFVYMPAGSGLDALRRSDGSRVWKLRTDSALEGSPAVWHDTVYIGKLSGAMVAVSAETGQGDVDVCDLRRGQARPGARQRPALLRRLRRGHVLPQRDHRRPDLAQADRWTLERLPLRWLLLDPCGRLRPRVRRQHRRQGVLVRRVQRRGGLVDDPAGMGLRLARGGRRARVCDLLAGHLRGAERPHRRRAVAASAALQHAVFAGGDRAARVRRRPRLERQRLRPRVRLQPGQRPAGVAVPRRQVLAGDQRRGTAGGGRLRPPVRAQAARARRQRV